MSIDNDFWADLTAQGINTAAVGLAYGRAQYPGLDVMPPAEAYSQGFLDGLRAFAVMLPLLTEGPHRDPEEFVRRMFDPDVLPVTQAG